MPWVGAAMLLLAAGVRAIALRSDAFARLSWSTALLTDEGFYIHNARNVVLFGRARTDEFNNMLIMPLLHIMQVAVFKLVGVGAVQARSISVVCGIASIVFVYGALRAAANPRAAAVAACLLAFDHVYVLYNRMALMDTPAAALLAAAMWLFASALKRESSPRLSVYAICAGALVAAAYATRSLAIVAVPALVLGGLRPARRPDIVIGLGIGLAGAFGAYVCMWVIPHAAELRAMNGYYLSHQLLPHSWARFAHNLWVAMFGFQRGLAAYFWRHSPVLFGIAIIGTVAGVPGTATDAERALVACCRMMLGLIAAFCCVVNYAPDRYYVIGYPALAVLAAALVCRPGAFTHYARHNRVLVSGLASFAGWHLGAAFAGSAHAAELAGPLGAVAFGVAGWGALHRLASVDADVTNKGVLAGCGTGWAVVNVAWMVVWITSLTSRQATIDGWLGRNLPADSILLGDVAPGFALDNGLIAVNVMPGLCNYTDPVRQFAGHPEYVVILDGRMKERYWRTRYPNVVADRNCVMRFRAVLRPFLDVGVYRVPTGDADARRQ